MNPYASHLFFPQFLDDNEPTYRKLGIRLGLEWGEQCDEVWFCYQHPDWQKRSSGMLKALLHWKEKGKTIRFFLFDSHSNLIREDSEP